MLTDIVNLPGRDVGDQLCELVGIAGALRVVCHALIMASVGSDRHPEENRDRFQTDPLPFWSFILGWRWADAPARALRAG